jgi:hypothetical protein
LAIEGHHISAIARAHSNRSRLPARLIIAFLLFLFLPAPAFTQESGHGPVYKYARIILDTLTAPGMHGRGYVSGGDSIAARYIADRFQELKLKSFGKVNELMMKRDYYQRFSFPVNTFPGKMELTINGKRMIPGKDFIVFAPSSARTGSYKRTITTAYPISESLNQRLYDGQLTKTPLFFFQANADSITKNIFKYIPDAPPVFFMVRDKLTMDVSTTTIAPDEHPKFNFIAIDILNTSLPPDPKKIKINIASKFVSNHNTQNVFGYIEGSQYPDSFIVFTAHYDHLGVMGHDEAGKEVYFPGANDNASGCAMLLSLANYYAAHPPEYSVAFIAFAGEEAGLLGSKYYTGHPLFPLKQIKFLINMDMVGTGDEGIKVVNATEFPTEFKTLQVLNSQSNYLTVVSPRGKAANSDHYFFYENGVKCFFIYTLGGIKAYHDIYDRAETLPLTRFEDLYKLIIEFGDWLQQKK